MSNNRLGGALSPELCNLNGIQCFIGSNRFTTNCAACDYVIPSSALKAEILALKTFYTLTNGGSWVNAQNWLFRDPCKNAWFGVTCDSSLTVVGLDLTNNNVIGPLPSSIGNLFYLNQLVLSGNGVTGSIPTFILNMTSLTNLTLSNNRLINSIPAIPTGITHL